MKRRVLRIFRKVSADPEMVSIEHVTSRVYPEEAAQKRRTSAPYAGSFALSYKEDRYISRRSLDGCKKYLPLLR